MRSLAVVLTLLFCGCPTASLPKPDGGNSQPDEDAGIACPEGFIEFPLIDFGCVARGDSALISQTDTFSLTPGLPTSPEFTVDGPSIRFAPTEERDVQATLLFFKGPCVLGRQRLRGTGVGQVVSWTPALVDFGYVNPGSTRTSSVTFKSCSLQPVPIGQLVTREGTSPSNTFVVDAGSLTIPAATRDAVTGAIIDAEQRLDLSFTPANNGPLQGQLTGITPLTTQGMFSVLLRGVGGGPIIEVMPSALDFGTVTMATTQVITIRNVGTRPTPVDPRANLHLGVDGGPPFFELAPALCGSVAMSAYDPVDGIDTTGSVTLSVTLQPAPMPRTCTLHVFSNDPNRPDVEVAITAQ